MCEGMRFFTCLAHDRKESKSEPKAENRKKEPKDAKGDKGTAAPEEAE